MKQARTITLILLVALASYMLALGGCAEKKVKVVKPKPVKVLTPQEIAAKHLDKAKGILAESMVDYDGLVSEYQAALKVVPGIPGVKFNIALAHMKKGEYHEALQAIESIPDEEKKSEEYILVRGKLMTYDNKVDEALAFFREYVKEHPGALNVRSNIATILRNKNKLDEAMDEVRQILMRDPSHPGAFNNLGLIYLAQDKVLPAKMVTLNGIHAQINAKKPEDASLYNNMGVIEWKLGNQEAAIGHFKKAQELDVNLVAPNHNMGFIALGGGNYQDAKVYFERVLSNAPKHKHATLGYAMTLMGLKDYKKAEKYYKKAEKFYPNDEIITFNMGFLYFDGLKNKKNSDKYFNKFLKSDNKTKALVDKAKLYLQLEPMQDAVTSAEETEKHRQEAMKALIREELAANCPEGWVCLPPGEACPEGAKCPVWDNCPEGMFCPPPGETCPEGYPCPEPAAAPADGAQPAAPADGQAPAEGQAPADGAQPAAPAPEQPAAEQPAAQAPADNAQPAQPAAEAAPAAAAK